MERKEIRISLKKCCKVNWEIISDKCCKMKELFHVLTLMLFVETIGLGLSWPY